MDSYRENLGADAKYLQVIVDSVRVCASYRPRFGQNKKGGLSLQEFQELYREDVFYSWLGLDDPMMYAAHKAAGGITSVYRQIGIGCERVFRLVLQDTLGLSAEDVTWSYETTTPSGSKRRLHLDGRIPLKNIKGRAARRRIHDWMKQCADKLGVEPNVFNSLTGVVFEVRQGYKSKDSKRQNADIANAASAYVKSYLPCALVLSNQIDDDILRRYRVENWVVVTGKTGANDPLTSTYDFMKNIIGYDLAGFFERSSTSLKAEVSRVLGTLLATGD